jgi:hypothetical protein
LFLLAPDPPSIAIISLRLTMGAYSRAPSSRDCSRAENKRKPTGDEERRAGEPLLIDLDSEQEVGPSSRAHHTDSGTSHSLHHAAPCNVD